MIQSISNYNADNPLVSICCATYNHENFIADALDGFLMQKTDFPVEILINDDCSKDKTAEIIKIYKKKFPNIIKPVFQNINQYSQGKKPLSQILLPRCKGKYVAFCEGDDFWTDSFKLQKQIDFLEANPNIPMCHTNYSNSNEAGIIIKPNALSKQFTKPFLSHLEVLEFFTPRTLTVVFRKDLLQNKVPAKISKVANGDTFMFALITQNGPAAYLDFNSGCHRLNKHSVYAMKPKFHRNKMEYETSKVLKTYFLKPEQQNAIKSRLSRKKIIESFLYLKKFKIFRSLRSLFVSLKLSRKPYLDKIGIARIMEFFKKVHNSQVL